jgi:molecular chaperone HtpG
MNSYLVADKITVLSKKFGDNSQWKWESSAGNTYTLSEMDTANLEGDEVLISGDSGTKIILQLKDECDE